MFYFTSVHTKVILDQKKTKFKGGGRGLEGGEKKGIGGEERWIERAIEVEVSELGEGHRESRPREWTRSRPGKGVKMDGVRGTR